MRIMVWGGTNYHERKGKKPNLENTLAILFIRTNSSKTRTNYGKRTNCISSALSKLGAVVLNLKLYWAILGGFVVVRAIYVKYTDSEI